MFDWFRKKKKNAPEARILEDQTIMDTVEEPESRNATEETASAPEPVAEPVALEEAPAEPPEPEEAPEAQDDEFPPEEPSSPEDTSPKKGLFARFRKKFSSSETPDSEAQVEPADEIEQAEDIEPLSDSVEDQADISPLEPENEVSSPESMIEAPAPETAPRPPEPEKQETAIAETGLEPPEEAVFTEDIVLIEEEEEATEEEDDDEVPRTKIFARFKEKLSATRNRLAGRLEALLSSVRAIDDDLLDELEELLITADLGVQTTTDLLYKIRGQVAKKELSDAEALKEALKKRIMEMVDLPCPPRPQVSPMVIMVVGINGVGKTTTIAKLARRLKQDDGQKVLLAAGDTFRSAAVEQLAIWAERLGVDIVSQPTGADASAVVFDALTAARSRKADVVIIDTAGRLHTKVNLMDELKKIKRVAGKAMPGAPHHTILVLDGNTGQNAQRQAQTFHEAVGVDSIIVTKLDGTAKGGVIVSITNELKIPIAFVGLGESFEDLQPFDARAFTEAILEP